jgi:hypothetical protein
VRRGVTPPSDRYPRHGGTFSSTRTSVAPGLPPVIMPMTLGDCLSANWRRTVFRLVLALSLFNELNK